MSKKLLVAGVVAALLPVASVATADRYDPSTVAMFELRFGPYRPAVDSAFGGTGPYEKIFGTDTRYMLGFEGDWEIYRLNHVGTFGLGGAIGYTKANGTANFADGTTGSAEETSLMVVPLSALAVARFDVLARETVVPLVPYVKFGPSIGFWQAANGSGTSVAKDGTKGEGKTFGYHWAVGGMLLLDIIDRQAARAFSIEQGVHHSYLFFEYTGLELSGVSQTNAMRVGCRTWNLGFAFEI